jgi:hypothetical protein
MKKFIADIIDFFSDKENPEEPCYDPVHVAGMIVVVLFAITILFWLLWSLLVFGGGIQEKVVPFILVLVTAKTARDFGYQGYPYEMGVFDGWVTNLTALVIAVVLVIALWHLYHWNPQKNKKT